MKNVLRFPNGASCRLYVIAYVLIEDSGVGAYSGNDRLVGWIPEGLPWLKERLAEIINDCLDADKKFVQPDWEAIFAGFRAEVEAAAA